MPLTPLARFQVDRLEILGPDGRVDAALMPELSKDELLKMHRLMVLCRVFDERAFKLQRQGRLGTYPQIMGQEATQVVPALCLRPQDWLVPTYRGQGAYFARGMDLKNSLLYWAGDDRGVAFPEGSNDLIFAIPVASHLTQAAGLAWAAKLQKKDQVALAWLGDGASSKGDFHEALVFAGVYKLPVIYFIENNGWAISVPRSAQSAGQTLAQKALAEGLPCVQVDGNDAFAVHKAVSDAVARARRGEGATVIEAVTYRMGNHTTADDATRYRDAAEAEAWKAKDPITRLEAYLRAQGVLDEEGLKAVWTSCDEQVKQAVADYEALPEPDPRAMFDNMFAGPHWVVDEQRKEFDEILRTRQEALAMEAPMPEGRFP